MLSGKRVLVTGGLGFLGRNIVNQLKQEGCEDVMTFRSNEYDLRIPTHVRTLLNSYGPDIIIHAAAQAGGIGLNRDKPGELFFNNMLMGLLLMEQSRLLGVEKFVQIGTVCEYPVDCVTPFKEESIWDGFPEITNSAYGVSKKALLVMGQAYRQQYGMNVIHLLPVNLYGPGDNFDPASSHVIPALIRKISDAKKTNQPEVVLWGTGKAKREFLYVDDAARGIVQATKLYDKPEPVNIGTGMDISIADLANDIASDLDYDGAILFDQNNPDGQPNRKLNIEKAFKEFQFVAQIMLAEGLERTIKWYKLQS